MESGYVTVITQQEDGTRVSSKVRISEGMTVREVCEEADAKKSKKEEATAYVRMKNDATLASLIEHMESFGWKKIEFIKCDTDHTNVQRYQIKKIE